MGSPIYGSEGPAYELEKFRAEVLALIEASISLENRITAQEPQASRQLANYQIKKTLAQAREIRLKIGKEIDRIYEKLEEQIGVQEAMEWIAPHAHIVEAIGAKITLGKLAKRS